jgi:hypothetical protein
VIDGAPASVRVAAGRRREKLSIESRRISPVGEDDADRRKHRGAAIRSDPKQRKISVDPACLAH